MFLVNHKKFVAEVNFFGVWTQESQSSDTHKTGLGWHSTGAWVSTPVAGVSTLRVTCLLL